MGVAGLPGCGDETKKSVPAGTRRSVERHALAAGSVSGQRFARRNLVCYFFSALAAASTSSAWPGTLTLRQLLAMRPLPSIRKVERSTPMYLRPYIDFSTHTP